MSIFSIDAGRCIIYSLLLCYSTDMFLVSVASSLLLNLRTETQRKLRKDFVKILLYLIKRRDDIL